MRERYGTLIIATHDKNGSRLSFGARTSVNPNDDVLTCTKALEFRDAALRDGRVYVCALVPRWKRVLLRAIGIKARDLITKG